MFELDVVCFAEAFRFDRSAMRRFAMAHGAITVVATGADGLAGFAIVNPRNGGRAGYLTTLDVSPGLRRRGLATMLLGRVEEEASACGAAEMRLHVWTENTAAVMFYERADYLRVRINPGYYGGNLDGWEYRKQLGTPRHGTEVGGLTRAGLTMVDDALEG